MASSLVCLMDTLYPGELFQQSQKKWGATSFSKQMWFLSVLPPQTHIVQCSSSMYYSTAMWNDLNLNPGSAVFKMQPFRHDATHGFNSNITQRIRDISINQWASTNITINLDIRLTFLGWHKIWISKLSNTHVPQFPMLYHSLSSRNFLNTFKIIYLVLIIFIH